MISLNNSNITKKRMPPGIVLIATLFFFCSCQTKTKLMELPPLPLGGGNQNHYLGVSAPFCSIYNEYLWIGGGCNFPDIPAAKGGKKKYYAQLWRRPINDFKASWELFGELPIPLAYGVSIAVEDGIVFLGGENEHGPSDKVFKLILNKDTEMWHELNAIPEPVSNFTAVAFRNNLYIIGGNTHLGASNRMYRYSLYENKWRSEKDFPGIGRIQPTSCFISSFQTPKIFVIGGFYNGEKKEASTIATEILSFDLKTNQWSREKVLKTLDTEAYTPTGGAALSRDNKQILLVGGVNYQQFEEAINRSYQIELAKKNSNRMILDSLLDCQKKYLNHPIDWYQFNRYLVEYIPQSKSFKKKIEAEDFARAGAGIALSGDTLFIIGGELKPGIRTPKGIALIFQ